MQADYSFELIRPPRGRLTTCDPLTINVDRSKWVQTEFILHWTTGRPIPKNGRDMLDCPDIRYTLEALHQLVEYSVSNTGPTVSILYTGPTVSIVLSVGPTHSQALRTIYRDNLVIHIDINKQSNATPEIPEHRRAGIGALFVLRKHQQTGNNRCYIKW